MAEGQRWVGGAQGRDAHCLEAGVVQSFGVVVMVAEDQDLLSWIVPHLEHQPLVPPGVRMGYVAQADDRVGGVYAPAPFPQQVVVSFRRCSATAGSRPPAPSGLPSEGPTRSRSFPADC